MHIAVLLLLLMIMMMMMMLMLMALILECEFFLYSVRVLSYAMMAMPWLCAVHYNLVGFSYYFSFLFVGVLYCAKNYEKKKIRRGIVSAYFMA